MSETSSSIKYWLLTFIIGVIVIIVSNYIITGKFRNVTDSQPAPEIEKPIDLVDTFNNESKLTTTTIRDKNFHDTPVVLKEANVEGVNAGDNEINNNSNIKKVTPKTINQYSDNENTSIQANSKSQKPPKPCEINNTGEVCFENKSNSLIKVELKFDVLSDCSDYSSQILEIGERKCFYSRKTCTQRYVVKKGNDDGGFRGFYSAPYSDGEVLVEKCQSQTVIIR